MPKALDPSRNETFLTFRLSNELKKKLDALAKVEDRSAGTVARRAVEAYAAAAEKKNG